MKTMLPRITRGQAFPTYASYAVPQKTVFTVVLGDGVAGALPVFEATPPQDYDWHTS
jgi:hypothetical protein